MDCNTVSINDGVTLGISLRDIDDDGEDNTLGSDDGFIVGFKLATKEGEEDGFSLGNSVHIWYVYLQV